MSKSAYSDVEYYEQLASTRWGRYISDAEKKAILTAHRRAAAPSVVLDVGASGGRWSQLLSSLGWRAICTDVNERSLAVCQGRLPKATCVLVDEDDETLPCEDGSVDLILCMQVFAVMPASWFLEEANRVLGPSGLLVGEFNNKCSLRGLVKHTLYRLREPGGIDYYSTCYRGWKSHLRSKGFELIHEVGICWMPFSISSNSRLIGPFVALERLLGLGRVPNLSPRVVFVARRCGAA
jgi:ubiquinone/menaquinone biosynthesis C-methylase UbiE